MSQVSLLSVDVGQTSELQGGKGDARIKSQANTSAFSDAMEQHYPPQKNVESNDKLKQNGNFASKAANLEQQTFNRDDSLKQDKLPKPSDDADILPVPLPIEDDVLTAKAQFKDGADLLPVPTPIEDDLLTGKAKSKGDADILPVPLPIQDDLLTAKAKSKGDAAIMPVPVSPLKITGRTIEQPSKAWQGSINSANPALKTSHEFNAHAQAQPQLQAAQTAGVLVNQAEHDDTVDLLNMLHSAEKLITKASKEQASLEQNGKSTTTKTEPLLATHQRITASNSLSAGQELLTKAVKTELPPLSSSVSDSLGDSRLIGSNTNQVLTANAGEKTAESVASNLVGNIPSGVVANTVQSAVRNAIASEMMPNKTIADDNNALTLEQADALDAKLLAKQASEEILKQSAHLATEENIKHSLERNEKTQKAESEVNELDVKAAKQITPAELNVEHKVTNGENREAKVQDGKASNLADFKQLSDHEPVKIRSVNQSTASVMANSTSESKVDIHQKIVSNEVSEKPAPAASGSDAEKLMKAESEKLAPQADKTASVFNQTLDAQAAKPIASSGELAAQQEQSFESAINKLTTHTVQTQKSITAVNTETIAIYRKDFADAVKDKVMVMINQKIQQVEIQLDPPEMGNIHVRVNLQNEQAAVQFVVQNQQAKEALEQNMAKLRDMLAENGVDVGDASIEQRQAKEHHGNGLNSGNKNGESGDLAEDNSNENDSSVLNMVKASSTGIDYYA